ncbi:PilZ domain-containing protein [Legionella sp. W05-934-2]|jgi:type IV pilus assembly protein PilZ|uniref:PilZ domain-containing protein n=1 Tax=Legionella sp. W05-934-2 TaxID=1198649 RepID=UPI0034621041
MSDEIKEIECIFKTENALYMAYMPYVREGGLFIRMSEDLKVGTEVMLTIFLLDEPEPYQIRGKAIWYTPKGAQGNRPAGIGFQFMGENSRPLCNKIETYLAGMLKSTQSTDTI